MRRAAVRRTTAKCLDVGKKKHFLSKAKIHWQQQILTWEKPHIHSQSWRREFRKWGVPTPGGSSQRVVTEHGGSEHTYVHTTFCRPRGALYKVSRRYSITSSHQSQILEMLHSFSKSYSRPQNVRSRTEQIHSDSRLSILVVSHLPSCQLLLGHLSPDHPSISLSINPSDSSVCWFYSAELSFIGVRGTSGTVRVYLSDWTNEKQKPPKMTSQNYPTMRMNTKKERKRKTDEADVMLLKAWTNNRLLMEGAWIDEVFSLTKSL